MEDTESTTEATTEPAKTDAGEPFETPFERAARIAVSSSEKRQDRTWYAGDKGRAKGTRAADIELDPRWLGALEDHLGDAEELRITVRKGASDYVDLFSQRVIFVDGEQGRDAAPRIGADIWKACLRHTTRHGPVLDFQLVIEGKRAKGKRTELACESIRISLIERASESDTEGADPMVLRTILSHTSGLLREARLDKEEHRIERGSMIAIMMSLLGALPTALDNVAAMIAKATELHDAGAAKLMHLIEHEIERERKRFEAEFSIAKIEAIADGIKGATEVISGEAGAAFLQWLASSRGGDAAPSSVQDAARQLAASILVSQAKAIGESATDQILAALDQAAKAPAEELALPPIAGLLRTLEALGEDLSKAMTPRQRTLLAFLRGRLAANSSSTRAPAN
ncbi:MAG: hypothetical protein A2V88_00810 [Elusimicrobia bacterium RBG_16_66_12]|nr:MAG: hypothetical protein A2V88_00810 [Elusimicrobia bacterium RBG_16_66_12]